MQNRKLGSIFHSRLALYASLGALLAACGGEDSTTPAGVGTGPGVEPTVPDGSNTLDPTATGPVPTDPSVPSTGPGPDSTGPEPSPDPDTPVVDTPDTPIDESCNGTGVEAPKRMVRLSSNQLVNSIRSLLGDEVADSISATFEIGDPTERTFPPLNSPREGSVLTDAVWQEADAIAQDVGEYVLQNFAEVTGCTDEPTAQCGQDYATMFAEQAFRRPLTAEETTRIIALYDNAQAEGGTIQEAVQYSVYAALSAPQFLYRSEFGGSATVAGALTQYEIASLLSYFITDGPPDQELLGAAASQSLTNSDQIAAQVDRLLATDEAKVNLQSAMYAYFGVPTSATIIIDNAFAPEFTEGLRASMMRESELFLNDTLWSQPLDAVLTSDQTYVNEGLANLYGVTAPATVDEDGFGQVTLPAERTGLLTQPGFLLQRSSPERGSVVRRGLLINQTLLCATNPPFPEGDALEEQIEEVAMANQGASERELVQVRADTSPCNSCHLIFDAYGLALENFDLIGKYRDVDEEGRPIDASVTLPPPAGGATVPDAVTMATEITNTGAFRTCVAKNLISYALAEGSSVAADSCSTRAVATALAAGDQTFSSLVREVAISQAFSYRNAGGAQ